jgi:cytochrome c
MLQNRLVFEDRTIQTLRGPNTPVRQYQEATSSPRFGKFAMKVHWIAVAAVVSMLAGAGQVFANEALARKSGCLECHNVDRKVIGPPYRDVGARYKGIPEARAALIEKVKKGGKGHWTEITAGVPMPPHGARLSDADIEKLVDWVLSLSQ